MPFEIKHGSQGGTIAGQIIAQAGQAELQRQQQQNMLSQQLQQQRALQMMHIDAQADLQKQSADEAMARTAIQHGLQGQLQEQMFSQRIQGMKEEAKLQAQQFDYQFTAKQKQQIAAYNNARQDVESSSLFTPEEKQQALRIIDLQQAGIKPSAMPSNKYQWPTINGQQTGVGIQWTDEDGARYVGELDANGNPTHKLLVRPDQTPKYLTLKGKQELEIKKMDKEIAGQNAIQKAMVDSAIKLFSEEIEYDTGKKDEKGGAIYGTRNRSPEEVMKIMQNVQSMFGGGLQQTEQSQSEDAESILQQALSNPEMLRDPQFRSKVVAARQSVGQ